MLLSVMLLTPLATFRGGGGGIAFFAPSSHSTFIRRLLLLTFPGFFWHCSLENSAWDVSFSPFATQPILIGN